MKQKSKLKFYEIEKLSMQTLQIISSLIWFHIFTIN